MSAERFNNQSGGLLEVHGQDREILLYSMADTYVATAGPQYSGLYGLLQEIKGGNKKAWRSTYLSDTKEGWEFEWGMNVQDALKCLVDIRRTSLLIDGVTETVRSVEQRKGSGIVAIDAGTGTGILAMALASHDSVDKVVALEINGDTARITPQFIEQFNLGNKIELIECDATQVDLGDLDADILVSENLASGLFNEPQYQIIRHLSQFLTEDAKILPHKATVLVYLGRSEWELEEPWNQYTISARLIPDLTVLAEPSRCFEVKSVRNMQTPHIKGTTDVVVADGLPDPNVLIVCTDFQINEGKDPIVLEHDTAEFLGKSSAFRLPEPVRLQKGKVSINLDYPAGYTRKHTKTEVKGNEVTLRAVN